MSGECPFEQIFEACPDNACGQVWPAAGNGGEAVRRVGQEAEDVTARKLIDEGRR
jgi:hypothetical protein